MIEGKVIRINGPIIKATGLGGSGLYDVVEIGEKRLIGEIIRLEGDLATIQIYEENTGMRVGESAWSLERPLSVHMGPGLLGTIYDGIQRPLTEIKKTSGGFIMPGIKIPPLSLERKWHFTPSCKTGDAAAPGTIVGEVKESATIVHKLVVFPEMRRSKIEWIATEGDFTISEPIVKFAGGVEMTMAHYWPVRKPRPYIEKMGMDEPLITGQRVIDVFFPISRGGTSAIPGGFGTGKTMTQHALAKWCDADIIVYIGCGERGNEMTDVLTEFPKIQDPRTGKSLMERTILIANTSNMPVAAREVSIYTGVTLAEYYRDMGYDVAIMADSTSRWAEALRELSGRLEEMPADEGFPAYLPTRLAEFYERAGKVRALGDRMGSISVIGAVSPPGGDFSEPVTQHTKRFIRCFWALDRDLANARHYPAISWIDSYSEYAEEIRPWWEKVNPFWSGAREKAIDLLKREQRLSQIVKLIGPDALPDNQRLILLVAEMIKNGFLQQNAFDDIDMFSVPDKQVRILKLIMDFYDRALAIIQLGAPLLKVRELSCLEKLVRAKSSIANDQLGRLDEIEALLVREMDELERSYRR
jgi:V/A-type H+/Na+-transporting ATPase subunit A